MNARKSKADITRLRSPERVARLEVERVVELCLEKLFVTRVLDVGCSTGLFSEAFSLRNLAVTGIDNNPLMVKAASDMVIDATFKAASAEALPFTDKSFDLVFIAPILHNGANLHSILGEARRVAKYRVAILEWPYRAEPSGPPLEHRLEPDLLKKTAHRAGLIQIEKIDIEHMVFYRMKPK